MARSDRRTRHRRTRHLHLYTGSATAQADLPTSNDGGQPVKEPVPARSPWPHARSATLPGDPIVVPGLPGPSHMHSFFGNDATGATPTRRPCSTETATAPPHWTVLLLGADARRCAMTKSDRLSRLHRDRGSWRATPRPRPVDGGVARWSCLQHGEVNPGNDLVNGPGRSHAGVLPRHSAVLERPAPAPIDQAKDADFDQLLRTDLPDHFKRSAWSPTNCVRPVRTPLPGSSPWPSRRPDPNSSDGSTATAVDPDQSSAPRSQHASRRNCRPTASQWSAGAPARTALPSGKDSTSSFCW